MMITLAYSLDSYGDYKIYYFFVKAYRVEGPAIFVTYLTEVGYYERPSIVDYNTRSHFNETDNLSFKFEMPYSGPEAGLAVKCQIFSKETGLWKDTKCTGQISNSRVKVTNSSIVTTRLLTVEENLVHT
jgi:hypothetical protein